MKLKGAGSTFAGPLYEDWIRQIERKNPQLKIAYDQVASQEGISAALKHKVDFAGSDVPLSQLPELNNRSDVLEIATAASAVAPMYNVVDETGVRITGLRFSCKTLAGIFAGDIERWDSQQIKDENPAVKDDLPNKNNRITVVYGSDGSGTTFLFTTFLATCGWPWEPNFAFPHPPKRALGAERSQGVADAVSENENSIGYAEYNHAAADNVDWGYVQNRWGTAQDRFKGFVRARVQSIREAEGNTAPQGSLLDGNDERAYPISAITWLLVPLPPRDLAKDELCTFLKYALGQGQDRAPDDGYAELSPPILRQQRQAVQQTCPGLTWGATP